MSQPPAYIPQTEFLVYQAQQAWFPGQQLDVEFNDLGASIDAIRANLALIQKDDGTLGNGVVGWGQLSPAFQLALRAQGFTGAPSSGPNTWLGTQSFLGANTAAIVADGAQMVVQNSNIKQSDVFGPITGGVVYDAVRSTVYIPPGSSGILNAEAFGAYVRSRSGTTNVIGNGVLYYGLATATQNSTCIWGSNFRIVDTEDGLGHGYTGIQLIGEEFDFDVFNTATVVQGSSVNMTAALVQPFFAAGYNVVGTAAAQFTYGFVSQEGSILSSGAAFYVGAQVKGATNVRNIASQGLWFQYYDGSSPTGVAQAWKYIVNTSGDMTLTSTESASKHFILSAILQTNSAIFSSATNPLVLAQSTGTNPAFINVDNVAGGQQAALNLLDAGVKQWQLVKQTNNNFLLFDAVGNTVIMTAGVNNGAMSLTPANVLNLNPSGAHGVAVGGASDPGTTNLAVQGSVFAGTSFAWPASSVIKAPSDGILELLNTAGTGFTRLQFGGTTASFPAIRRNATALNFRLADDSGDAAISAASLSVGANQVVAARQTGWTVATGTPQRSTFTTGGVTLAQLAGVVMALEQDLIAHGLIGT